MNAGREDGIALLVAMMTMLLMTAIGVVLVLTTTIETSIAGNFRAGQEAFYAADAGVERAMDDLATVPDWNGLLDGTMQSGFVDGPPGGSRTLPDGSSLDLNQAVNIVNCPGKHGASCTTADMNAITAGRPWGANNPQWKLYAYGPLSGILPGGTVASLYYVMLLVGDDPLENDGDPLRDGAVMCKNGQDPATCNPGTGLIVLHGEAFGPRGAHQVIEATVGRAETGVRILSWRVLR